jgi:NADH-quinone oxidoreductase subunit N
MTSLLIIFVGAILVLFVGLNKKENTVMPLAIGVLILALAFIPFDWMAKEPAEWQVKYVPAFMMAFDRSALAFMAILISGTCIILALFGNKQNIGSDQLGLILFSLCGAIIMTAFTNLVMLFLGIEALSIPLYVLAGARKKDIQSNEAAIKYFLMGAFSTALFLMGCAFIYGGTGGIDLESIKNTISMVVHVASTPALVKIGLLLLLIGMSFKISAFPFHFWSPDVYQGSPNRATVFMATVAKIAAFAAFFRLFNIAFSDLRNWWGDTLAVISALTILVGNIGALRQTNFKRTMAYSSVAHAGYMLLGILAAPLDGFWGLLVYGVAYTASSVVLFYILNKVSEQDGNTDFEAFNGFGKANKWLGLALIVALFSLAGIPITAGFAGKYTLFTAVFGHYKWLIIVALVGSAISIAYYFRLLKAAFFTTAEGTKYTTKIWDTAWVLMAVLVVIGLGMFPSIITGIQLFSVK